MSTVADDLDTMRLFYLDRVAGITNAELRDELRRVMQRPFGGEQAAIVRAELRRRRKTAATAGAKASRTPHAAQIVHRAIGASGLGEPWCMGPAQDPDAVRVGNRLVVVEAGDDSLGALMTLYAIDGGAATPVEALAVDNNVAVGTLTSWLREAGRPMTWKRLKSGLYRSGKYLVGQLDTSEWFAEGPGVDEVYDFKAAAQAGCERARGISR